MKILSRVFRGKFVAALRRAYMRDQLDLNGGSEPLRDPARWDAFIDALFQTDWVVYAKPAFGGEHVTFQWKDYAHGQQSRTMTLSALEFLRRFVQHILPRRFVRIRQSGFSREYLPRCARGAREDTPQQIAPVGRDARGGDRGADTSDLDMSSLRRHDDHWSDPHRAPADDVHARL